WASARWGSWVFDQLDLVGLDQGIREQLFAHALEIRAHLLPVVVAKLEIDDAADTCGLNGEAELLQRSLDGLSLRVEDPRLGADEHGCPHPSTDSGSST